MRPLVIGLAVCMPALAAQPDPSRTELAKLEGKWIEVYAESAGQDLDKVGDEKTRSKEKDKYSVTIAGQKWIAKPTQAPAETHTFKIDATRKPMQIDWTVELDDKKLVIPGIYTIDGDALKVCYPFPFEGDFRNLDRRPTDFKTTPKDNFLLKIFKRYQP